MEFSVDKPIMYFLALTVSPTSVFFFFCQTNSFVLLFHLSYACVAMEVLWSSQQQQRRRNDLGRASMCRFFTSHRFPRGPCPVAAECSRMSEELTQNPHTLDQCVLHRKVIRKATKERLVCDLSSLLASYLFLS